MLFIKHNIGLGSYSTMRLGGKAAHLVHVKKPSTLVRAIKWAQQRNLPFIIVGDGSNIVWRDEGYPGLVIVNQIKGYQLTYKGDSALLRVAAGENWDNVVRRSVQAGWSGLECLSLIPGTAGATPVQNVGAYGQEIKYILEDITAYDSVQQKTVTLLPKDCAFGYRTSRLKTTDRGRYAIFSLTLRLTKAQPQPPFYRALENHFKLHGITEYSPQIIRDAVINIRSSKLPDPAKIANNGSFFANPVIDKAQADKLLKDYPDAPHWDAPKAKVKLSAAWLVGMAGFSDYKDSETGMATWPKQSLVLVNESANSTADLLAFKQIIVNEVRSKFGITLQQEPELLP